MKIHYSGGLKYVHSGKSTILLPGWPICKTGHFAETVQREGNQTPDTNAVTCKVCKAMMKRAGIMTETAQPGGEHAD